MAVKVIESIEKKYPNGYDKIVDSDIWGNIAIYYSQMKKVFDSILHGIGMTEDELDEIDYEEAEDWAMDELGIGGILNGLVDDSRDVIVDADEGEFDGGIIVPDKNICVGFVASACEKNEDDDYDMLYPYPQVQVFSAGKYASAIKNAVNGTAFKVVKGM